MILAGKTRVKELLTLVRIHVPLRVHDRKSGVSRRIVNPVWDHIVKNHKRWCTDDVRLLYMTHRHLQEDTSLIVDAKDADTLVDYLIAHIASIDNVRGIWVINLGKMRFFKLPDERPGDFSRFTVTIDAIPRYLDEIYEKISALKPGRDIIVTYIVHTFQSFKASIMVSMLARSRSHAEAFVKDYIRPLEGVVDVETTFISKTMRLASPEEWEESVGTYFVAPGGQPIKDIDADDDSLIAGC